MELSSSILLSIFENQFKDDLNFEPLSTGKNPCHFKYAGQEFYAYIKNLSPAYFTNKDIWRAQLTGTSALEEIKATDDSVMFVLLGYDEVNHVYATWNPYFTKQRIGTASSPSFYSRLSEQNAVGKCINTFKMLSLNNDQEVLLFNANCLPEYLANVNDYFEDGEYVAIGSKRRTDANEAFRTWNDLRQIEPLKNYCERHAELDIAQGADVTITRFIKEGFFVKHKQYFLKYDSIEQYFQAIADLGKAGLLDTTQLLHLAFYCRSLIESYSYDEDEKEIIDWEERNTDEDGKLVRITNPELVEKLREFLYNTEYPDHLAAMNVAADFYGEKFPSMGFADWMKAIKNTIWDAEEARRISIGEQNATETKTKRCKRQTYMIQGRGPFNLRRFVLEAVRVFTDTFKGLTYDEIKEIFPECTSNNYTLFVTELEFSQMNEDQKRRYFHGDGEVFTDSKGIHFYVSNQWSAPYAMMKIMPLLDGYGIAWEKVENDDTENTSHLRQKGTYEKKTNRTSVRLKIYVTMPDGEKINGNNVAETYCRTITRIGPERIRALNLTCLYTNLIATKDEIPNLPGASYQPVGGGFYVNTHSSTNDKFNWLEKINGLLNLGMAIELR